MTLTFRTIFPDPVAEGTSPRITAQITDEAGAGIPAATLDALTLTLYDVASGTVVNSRDHLDILNANGGSVDAQGNLAWQGEAADTALDTTAGEAVLRVALIEWTWAAGTRAGKHEVAFEVWNLGQVPETP